MRELFTLLQFIHGAIFSDFDTFEQVFGRILAKGRDTSKNDNSSGSSSDSDED